MPSGGLIVLARVLPGKASELCELLNRLGNDIKGKKLAADPDAPRIELRHSSTIHFARLAVMDDPDAGEHRKRLLLATDFDGPFEQHVKELLDLSTDQQAIWGCCEDFGGMEDFADFLRRNRIEPNTYYIAFRGVTLTRIRSALKLRAGFCALLAQPGNEPLRAEMSVRLRFTACVSRVWNAVASRVGFVLRAVLGLFEVITLVRQLGWNNVEKATCQIAATLGRLRWIRLLNFVLRNRETGKPCKFSEASAFESPVLKGGGHPPEDSILQNQLTLVTDVGTFAGQRNTSARAGTEPRVGTTEQELPRQRAVLAIIDLYARTLATPGDLAGISTIHTVRWTLIDGGRRLLMVSNYDGSWENYIDEFAEMILSGLNAIWCADPDFPAAGPADLPAFKQFLRDHQVPANVFYSAYPRASVLNLKQDLEFQSWNDWVARCAPPPAQAQPAPATSQP